MPNKWFANWGQVLQLGLAAAAVALALVVKFGAVSVPAWLVPALVGGAIAGVFALAVQRISRSSTPLKLVSTRYAADPRDEVAYKHKLYVVLRNAGKSALIVGPQAGWEHRDLDVKTVREHVWQVEGSGGWRNNDWTKEAVAVRVEPGRHVRTWIGLADNIKVSDIDHFTAERRAGALATSVAPANDVTIDI